MPSSVTYLKREDIRSHVFDSLRRKLAVSVDCEGIDSDSWLALERRISKCQWINCLAVLLTQRFQYLSCERSPNFRHNVLLSSKMRSEPSTISANSLSISSRLSESCTFCNIKCYSLRSMIESLISYISYHGSR